MGAVMALILVPAGADLPIAPPPREAALYFPTTVGTKWVHESAAGKEVESVTRADEKSGRKIVTVEKEIHLPSGVTKSTYRMEVSPAGLFRLSTNDRVNDPPQCLLKLPHAGRESWKWPMKEGDILAFTLTAVGVEEVESPVGTFSAIRVEMVITGNDFWVKKTEWYARGVGVVKYNYESRKDVIKSPGTGTLTSFTLGKSEKP